MKNTPFFTIITPTFNYEKYLKECIQGIESQSCRNWEHIFIDSYSNDKTMKILNSYKKRNPHRVFIYRYPKSGISNAFNQGIKHSRGKYLNFLGSDDILESEALQTVYQKMKNSKFGWCYGNFKIINGQGKVIKKKQYRFEKFSYLNLQFHFYICHQTVFMKREMFNRYGLFRSDLKFNMDHEYWLRIGKKEKPLYIDKFLCRFRMDNTNISSDKLHQFKEKNIIFKEYGSPLNYWVLLPLRYLDFFIFKLWRYFKH